MDYQYYERKINDVIMKCPIEAGIEILVYNVLDYILNSKEVSLIDINRLWKDRDARLTTDAGVSDIAILSKDFEYKSDIGQVYGFVEVKATNSSLSETEQIQGQRAATNHYIYTNGLVWNYYENKEIEPKWKIVLTKSKIESINQPTTVLIDESKFYDLLKELDAIEWTEPTN